MKSTIEALLTDKNTRNYAAISRKLSSELSAGIPWWNKAE